MAKVLPGLTELRVVVEWREQAKEKLVEIMLAEVNLPVMVTSLVPSLSDTVIISVLQ